MKISQPLLMKYVFNTFRHQHQAFFVSSKEHIRQQYRLWTKELPNIQPFYAVKCNPNQVLLNTIKEMGSHFDCASRHEIQTVLNMGIKPEQIIFANPIKSIDDQCYAREKNIKMMTFDNEDELRKIKQYAPQSELICRLLTDDSGSLMRFGEKFGAPIQTVPNLLKLSRELRCKVIGTSFHIGSGCFEANTYRSAIALSKEVFEMATKLGLEQFTMLDIGGGFPGTVSSVLNGRVPPFTEFAGIIRSALDQFFPSKQHQYLRVIGEPGRFMATRFSTLFVKVQGKRKVTDTHFLYYINDGVYGSFNNIIFDHYQVNPIVIKEVRSTHTQKTTATIYGPTCDSMDCIGKNLMLPECNVGDWFKFENMGAYTSAAASTFNGMPKPLQIYI